jgi:hypothetical protein
VENGRTLPFAIEEVERLSNLGALVLGEREQRGLLGLRRHHAQRLEREGETERAVLKSCLLTKTWFPGRTAIREAEPAAVVMVIIDGPKGSGAFALAQHIANQTDLIMIDDSQLPFGAK